MGNTTDQHIDGETHGQRPTRSDTGTLKYHADLVTRLFIPRSMRRPNRIALDRSGSDPKHDRDRHQNEERVMGHVGRFILPDPRFDEIGARFRVLSLSGPRSSRAAFPRPDGSDHQWHGVDQDGRESGDGGDEEEDRGDWFLRKSEEGVTE